MPPPVTLNIGFGNRVIASRIVAVLVPGSSPMRRLKDEAKQAGKLGMATQGRRCRSLLLLDSGHVLLSALHPDTVCQRFETVSGGSAGDGDRIVASRIVAVFTSGSASVQRHKEDARAAGRLADLTRGKKCRSILLLDSGHLLLSAVHPDTLCGRLPALSRELPDLGEEG